MDLESDIGEVYLSMGAAMDPQFRSLTGEREERLQFSPVASVSLLKVLAWLRDPA